MTRLGIVVALAAEARALGVRHRDHDAIVALSPGVAVSVAGIGPERARSGAERLIGAGVGALLSCGTAAALCLDLMPGQLLLPGRVLRPDCSPVPVSSEWREQLHRRFSTQFSIVRQPLIATNEILTRPADKQQLFAETGAVSADMESAAVAAVAEDAGVPFAALRVIVDRAERRVPHWISREIDEFGRVRIGSVIGPMLIHSRDWADIFRLARDLHLALQTLRSVARNGCNDLKPDISASEAWTDV